MTSRVHCAGHLSRTSSDMQWGATPDGLDLSARVDGPDNPSEPDFFLPEEAGGYDEDTQDNQDAQVLLCHAGKARPARV